MLLVTSATIGAMTAELWMRGAVSRLADASIATARLDALVLLEDCTGIDRGRLLAHPELELADEQVKILNKLTIRRMEHEPLAYIRGKTEFYGREFSINKHVLEPRPESETMIELLKSLGLPGGAVIADIGTGSGALAVTAQLELPGTRAIGVDIDPACLEVASENAARHKTDISFLQGDLLEPLIAHHSPLSTLLCNLPYVPDGFHINPAAMNEPRIAIFGGPDGLDLYRQLFKQLSGLPAKPVYILSEAMPPQHQDLAELAASHGYRLRQTEDFIQLFTPV